MKTYVSIIIFLSLSILSFTASAQSYRIPKTERIFTPWDTDTTLTIYSDEGIISVTQEGKLVMFASPRPNYISRYYFYDEINKTWSKKQLTDDKSKLRLYNSDHSVGLSTFIFYGNEYDLKNKQEIKWLFNYGDSLYVDTITSSAREYKNDCVTPTICYHSEKIYAKERSLSMDGGIVTPYNQYLYRRTNVNGIIQQKILLKLEGGDNTYPESQQDYKNDMYFGTYDSETIVADIRRSYYIPQYGSFYKYYSLLSTDSGDTWKEIPTDFRSLGNKNNKQSFIKFPPGTFLYSSPRHGITPKKSVYFGFIDEHLDSVNANSAYANGKNGYYCLCNNVIDSMKEKDKFLIYYINNSGELQKFELPKNTFEYKNFSGSDSIIIEIEKEILYADDSIMYIQVVTTSGNNHKDYSAPQLYKIYLKEPINSVAEQPAITPLQLYPNPTDQTLRWNTASGRAVISDALGRTLLEVPASAMEADVSALAVGMYFLTIRNGAESAVRTFVVMR